MCVCVCMLYVYKNNEEEVMNLRGSGGKWKELEEKEKGVEMIQTYYLCKKIPF